MVSERQGMKAKAKYFERNISLDIHNKNKILLDKKKQKKYKKCMLNKKILIER